MKKVKFVSAAVLIVALVFCGTAFAKPNWLTAKYTGAEVRRTKGVEDPYSGNYYTLVLKFDLINNSKNGDIMTAIYDRSINWNGTFHVGGNVDLTWNVKYSMKGTDPYEGKWYPGQVYKYTHSVPLARLMKPESTHVRVGWRPINDTIKASGYTFKLGTWNFDCQVRSYK